MKHFCLSVAVVAISALSFSGPAVADGSSQSPSTSSEAYDQDFYSPPLGGEGCSTPTIKEKPIS